ncbi:hypothetical protein AB0C11_20830 [Streptomyces sp. NPDC039016]|uniref:hypothetical protein n=1 Tax=unclassified Streptomyces TaxID=2593676 RepID=UPI0033F8C1EC
MPAQNAGHRRAPQRSVPPGVARPPPRLLEDGSITWGRRHWDADRDGLPGVEVELRVSRGGRFHGRFMLQGAPGAAPPPAARLVAVTLANEVGVAFASVSPARA